EARKKLDFMSPMLQHFGVMGNLTLATSQIELRQTSSVEGNEDGFMTNTSRPMVNQAPYVVNFAMDYDGPSKTQARPLYHVSGKSIVAIGTNGLPDTYLQSRPMLDFTLTQGLTERLQVGMSAENLLNSLYIVTQGPEKSQSIATRSYRSGVSIGVQLGYAL